MKIDVPIKLHQYDGVQALRFLAALLVVTTHSFFYASERLGANVRVWDIGTRGVDIFFVISGFVMVVSSRNLINVPQGWAKFAIQRVTRIVPLYWLATSLKVLFMLFSAGMVLHAEFDLDNVLGSYFFIPYLKKPDLIEPVLGVGWTLVFEMFFYFVFSIALFMRVNIYVFVGAIMVLLSLMSLLRPVNYPVWMYLIDPIVLEFWFGMIIGYLTLNGKLIKSPYVAIVSLLTILWIVFVPGGSMSRVIVAGIPSALLVYTVVSIEPYLQNKIPKIILFFGAASYSLYLFHPLIAPIVPVFLNKVHFPILTLSVLLSIFVALSASALVYLYVELSITHLLRRTSLISRYTHKSLTEIGRVQ